MMRNGRRKFQKMKLISMALAAVTCLSLLSGIAAPSAQAAEDDDDMPIVLSLGDSYSSGEGCEPFYDQEKEFEVKVNEESHDWVAHRSENSWPGMLEFNGKKLKDYKDTKWYFQAASGAVTENIYNTKKKYNYSQWSWAGHTVGHVVFPNMWDYVDESFYPDPIELNYQLKIVQEKELRNKIDYVTVTIGGNDVGFTDIITTAAVQPGLLIHGMLDKKFDESWANFDEGSCLETTYEKIEEAVGENATIIVAGYPTLIAEVDSAVFTINEAKEINLNVRKFNRTISQIVEALKDQGMNIEFVSVEKEFMHNEAYSEDSYINEIMFTQAQDIDQYKVPPISAYSIHPNGSEAALETDKVDCGVEAYASAVQEKIDELEEKKQKEEDNKEEQEQEQAKRAEDIKAHLEEYQAFAEYLNIIADGSTADDDSSMSMMYYMQEYFNAPYDNSLYDDNSYILWEAARFDNYAIGDFDGDGQYELIIKLYTQYLDDAGGCDGYSDTYVMFEYDADSGSVLCDYYKGMNVDEDTGKDGSSELVFYKNGLVSYFPNGIDTPTITCFSGEDLSRLSILNGMDTSTWSKVTFNATTNGYDVNYVEGYGVSTCKTISDKEYKAFISEMGSLEQLDVDVYDFTRANIDALIEETGITVPWVADVDDYVGGWTNGRGFISIEKTGDNQCNIDVGWSGGAADSNWWTLTGTVGDDGVLSYTGTLTYTHYNSEPVNGEADTEVQVTQTSGTMTAKYLKTTLVLYWDDSDGGHSEWLKNYSEEIWNALFVSSGIATYTEDDAYQAVYNYLDSSDYDFECMSEHYGYLIVQDWTDSLYRVTLRSYTASFTYYYVDKYTGYTYISDYVPGIIDEETVNGTSFYIQDYLN